RHVICGCNKQYSFPSHLCCKSAKVCRFGFRIPRFAGNQQLLLRHTSADGFLLQKLAFIRTIVVPFGAATENKHTSFSHLHDSYGAIETLSRVVPCNTAVIAIAGAEHPAKHENSICVR